VWSLQGLLVRDVAELRPRPHLVAQPGRGMPRKHVPGAAHHPCMPAAWNVLKWQGYESWLSAWVLAVLQVEMVSRVCRKWTDQHKEVLDKAAVKEVRDCIACALCSLRVKGHALNTMTRPLVRQCGAVVWYRRAQATSHLRRPVCIRRWAVQYTQCLVFDFLQTDR
jgi:hypothetical protein